MSLSGLGPPVILITALLLVLTGFLLGGEEESLDPQASHLVTVQIAENIQAIDFVTPAGTQCVYVRSPEGNELDCLG